MHTLVMAAGLLLGIFAPRRRVAMLLVFAALLPVCGFVAAAAFAPFSIASGAALFLAASILAVVLARLFPRVMLAVVLLASAPVGSLPVGALPRGALIAIAVALVAAAIVLARFGGAGMRVACALIGARIVALGMHGEVPLWQKLAIAAAIFAVATVARRDEDAQEAPSPRAALAFGCLVGLVLGALPLVALGAAAVAPEGPRTSALRRVAPDGGLAWALPSEALIWEDRSGYEFLPNYDAVWLGAGRVRVAKLSGTTLSGRFSLHRPIAALREIKDDAELAALRTSARAVVEALREVRPLIRPGAREEEVASALMTAASKRGCDGGPSFPPIVTSGPRAARAHGTGNDGTLREGELVVIDIGCFARGYASDFTRTLAVSGRFSDRQRNLYDAVYAAQQAAVRACRPGAQLLRGPGSLNAIARDAIRARGIEPHNEFGIGHTVGLFVHDVGPTSGVLREGMVITIEPGIYLGGELGIRIEDTYLVTKDGCTPLTGGFPADLASVGG